MCEASPASVQPPMAASLKMTKRALRRHAAALLEPLTPVRVGEASLRIAAAVSASLWFASARSVSLFLSMEASVEVQTAPLVAACLAAGKTLYVPRVAGPHSKDMHMLHAIDGADIARFQRNPWGIPEPDETYPAMQGVAAGTGAAPLLSTFNNLRDGWRGAAPASYGAPSSQSHTRAPLDIVFIPGLAFEESGARLGHGKGYYDAFIALVKRIHHSMELAAPLFVGLCFDEQLLPPGTIPMNSHDQYLDMLVTPTRTIHVNHVHPQHHGQHQQQQSISITDEPAVTRSD